VDGATVAVLWGKISPWGGRHRVCEEEEQRQEALIIGSAKEHNLKALTLEGRKGKVLCPVGNLISSQKAKADGASKLGGGGLDATF